MRVEQSETRELRGMVYWTCDECGRDDDIMYRKNGRELCSECAFEEVTTYENMLAYINADEELKLDFYFNWLMNCSIDAWKERENISTEMYDLIDQYVVSLLTKEYMAKTLYGYVRQYKEEMLEYFDYERVVNYEE